MIIPPLSDRTTDLLMVMVSPVQYLRYALEASQYLYRTARRALEFSFGQEQLLFFWHRHSEQYLGLCEKSWGVPFIPVNFQTIVEKNFQFLYN